MREGKGKVVLEGKVVIKKLALKRKKSEPQNRERKDEKQEEKRAKLARLNFL